LVPALERKDVEFPNKKSLPSGRAFLFGTIAYMQVPSPSGQYSTHVSQTGSSQQSLPLKVQHTLPGTSAIAHPVICQLILSA
jgi:hypothetical protein